MKVIRLEDDQNQYFNTICKWYYDWLGKTNHETMEEIRYTFKYSINLKQLPQTFIAINGHQICGMYQLAMMDDLYTRPDLYPWVINVYVDKQYRNAGVCKAMMNSVKENLLSAGFDKVYLYTEHIGLYEKYGWEFIEEVPTFKQSQPLVRLYQLDITGKE